MSRSPLLPLALLCLTLAFACENEPVSAAKPLAPPVTAGTAGAAGATQPATVDCAKNRKGAQMVRIERKAQGDAFCIDATETTRGEYEAFLAEVGEAPSAFDSDPYCKASNRYGYQPQLAPITDDTLPACATPSFWIPGEHPRYPATCLDWCDASAYCAWAGKRLCGLRDGAKPVYDLERSTADSPSSEWQYACAEGNVEGAKSLPQSKACAPDPPREGVKLEDIDTRTACVGSTPPFDQIRDLAGNVREMTAEKTPDPFGSDIPGAVMRGVPMGQQAAKTTSGVCIVGGLDGLVTAAVDMGFRCCAD